MFARTVMVITKIMSTVYRIIVLGVYAYLLK
jgi:hypothetical protein